MKTKYFLLSFFIIINPIGYLSAFPEGNSSLAEDRLVPSAYENLILITSANRVILDKLRPCRFCYAFVDENGEKFVATMELLPGPKYFIRIYDPRDIAKFENAPNHLRHRFVENEKEVKGELFEQLNDFVLKILIQTRWGSGSYATGSALPMQYLSYSRADVGRVRAYTIGSTNHTDARILTEFGLHLKAYAKSKLSEQEFIELLKELFATWKSQKASNAKDKD